MATKQSVSFVEYGVFNYPEGMDGWRCYRMEIGGHAESCLMECQVWFPPELDVSKIEDLVDECQGLLKKEWL